MKPGMSRNEKSLGLNDLCSLMVVSIFFGPRPDTWPLDSGHNVRGVAAATASAPSIQIWVSRHPLTSTPERWRFGQRRLVRHLLLAFRLLYLVTKVAIAG